MATAGYRGKPKYKPEYCLVVKNATKMGMGISEVCELLDCTPPSFWRWYQKYPEFAESVDDGREHSDKRVLHTLYDIATKGSITKKTKTVTNHTTKEVITTEEIIENPPHTSSVHYWLTCRLPKEWSPKNIVETVEPDDGKEHTVTINVIPSKDTASPK